MASVSLTLKYGDDQIVKDFLGSMSFREVLNFSADHFGLRKDFTDLVFNGSSLNLDDIVQDSSVSSEDIITIVTNKRFLDFCEKKMKYSELEDVEFDSKEFTPSILKLVEKNSDEKRKYNELLDLLTLEQLNTVY